MTKCETCSHRVKDSEAAIPFTPDELPNEFRTWMFCELNIEGFPFKDECEDYEAKAGS